MVKNYLLVLSFLAAISVHAQNSNKIRVVGYIPDRSVAKMTEDVFDHINDAIYFGVKVDDDGNINRKDIDKDLNYLLKLKGDRSVNMSICFGGWGASDFFIEMTADSESRANFCRQTLELCRQYQLKGVDIDWEFPKNKAQKEGFRLLIKDLNAVLNPEGIDITVAVGFWNKQARLTASVEPYISGVNLMLYDNFSPLKGQASYTLVKRTIKRFIRKGIPAEKLFAGVPFYGRHRWWWKKDMSYNAVEGHSDAISPKGVYNGYFFDVPKTLDSKMELIREMNLGGIMIWELGQDVDINHPKSLLRYISERNKP